MSSQNLKTTVQQANGGYLSATIKTGAPFYIDGPGQNKTQIPPTLYRRLASTSYNPNTPLPIGKPVYFQGGVPY